MKFKPVKAVSVADFERRRSDNPNLCNGSRLCPQHDAIAKWRADNERLGLSHLNAWYERNAIPCGPMRRVDGIKGTRSWVFAEKEVERR